MRIIANKQAEEKRSWQETPPLSPSLRHWSGEIIERQNWLDKLADPLQQWVRSLSEKRGLARLKDFLHGTWFGHPLHPALTDVPVGAWTVSLLFDCVWLSSEDPAMAKAADMTTLIGSLGAGAAGIAGLADWSETDATDRRVGLMHGLLNAGGLLTSLVSYSLRITGKRRTAIALSGLNYALLLFSTYLGGELSFAKGIGVNHVAWEGGPDDFVPVIALTNLPEKQLTRVDAQGMPVILWKEDSTIHALAATCSHLGGPLDEGSCQDGTVTCPWHGSNFRLHDGAVVQGPAVYAQPTFAVRIRNGQVELRRIEHA